MILCELIGSPPEVPSGIMSKIYLISPHHSITHAPFLKGDKKGVLFADYIPRPGWPVY